MDPLDLPLIVCIAFLWTSAVCAIAYLIGRNHGWDDGYLKGMEDEHAESIPTIIRAKRDGLHAGRIIGLQERLSRVTTERDTARGHLAGTETEI